MICENGIIRIFRTYVFRKNRNYYYESGTNERIMVLIMVQNYNTIFHLSIIVQTITCKCH